MAKNEIFSTVFKGYKKEEVSVYIEEMSDQLQELKFDLDRKDVEIDRLKKEIAALQESNPQMDREAIEQELRAEYEAKISNLEAKANETADDSELEKKAKEYDECKDVLAELMIQARKNADDIVSSANEKALLVRETTISEFSKLGTDFSALQKNVGYLKDELRRNLDKIADQMDVFDEQLYSLQNDIDRMLDSLPNGTQQD